MSNQTNKKRTYRVRKKLKKVNSDRFRLTVFRSSKNLSAQIIDDKNNKTLVSATSIKKGGDNLKNKDISLKVAEILAQKAIEKKITKVYFDRGVYKYHGRVKVFAETLRKNGMEF